MITLEQYFGRFIDHPDATPQRKANAGLLLNCVNALLLAYPYKERINPNTESRISGTSYGGFRPQACSTGAPNSAHKTGMAVDVYDPLGELDDWITANQAVLEAYDLYREAPEASLGWTHLTTRRPPSGARTFRP